MIEMIFEGGYTYYMTSGEYMVLLGLAGLGGATVMGMILTIGTLLIRKLIRKIKH